MAIMQNPSNGKTQIDGPRIQNSCGTLLLVLLAIGAEAAPPAFQSPAFQSPALPHATSWVGNTYPGVPGWVQQDIRAMAVTPDGTVFTNVEWEEGGGNVGEYRDGVLVRYAKHTHGWGAGGGVSVAVNSKYVFIGMAMGNEGGGLQDEHTWPAKGLKWFGVSRRWRSDIAKAAPFAGGKGGQGDTLEDSFLVVAEVPERGGMPLAGMVANEQQLFVSDPNSSEIHVFDCETMKLKRRWKVELAGPLAIDRWGNLAMLQAATTEAAARVLCFGRGEEVVRQATLPREVVPSAICFRDNRLLVADTGPAQQILVFAPVPDAREMTLVETIGERGGLLAAQGAFGDRRFHDVRALGCDEHGNLYVAQDGQTGGGGTVLESYALESGKLNWRLFGLTFVDMADVDPADDTEVFTKEEHFKLDYAQPAGREWSYTGYTVDRFKYPQDPRLHIWSAGAWVRRIEGRRFLFVNDMNAECLQVYRFAPESDGEIAIPAALFSGKHISEKEGWPPHQPSQGAWNWHDANGNGAFDAEEYEGERTDAPPYQGWWVDRVGGLWVATETRGLRYFPVHGLNIHGVPQWPVNTMRAFRHPSQFAQVKRLRYLPESDTLFLAGTTAEHPNQHWKPSGPVIARYDGYLQGEGKLRWIIVAPYTDGSSGHSSCEPMGFDVAGDCVFVPYTGASTPDGVKHGRVEIFRAADGASVGHLEPSDDVGEIGLQDIRECLTAHRRADGEYVLFLEDDYKSKVLMYRWRPAPSP